MGTDSVDFEIDTGATCNIIHVSTVKKIGLSHLVRNTTAQVRGIHNVVRKGFGEMFVACKYRDQVYECRFVVLDGKKQLNVLGRHDCIRLGLIARVGAAVEATSSDHKCNSDVDAIRTSRIETEFADVLGDEIGCISGEFDIKLNDNVTPIVHPPRSVPAPIRESVKAELERLEGAGIISKVTEPTEWVSSMVVARKKNGKVRICIDPSDLNKSIKREHFPMNTIEDIATRLNGSKVFSTLDANSGYFQLQLSQQSSLLTTFNSPFGRFKYLRMPMGLKCSAEIFQREMCRIFSDLPGVEIVVDDILVHGKDAAEHDSRLRKVLQRCRDANLKLNAAKSKIGCSEVIYVGHRLTGDGLLPAPERIKSISSLGNPKDHDELGTFLGMVAYVAKFIPNVSALCEPLRVLHKSDEWYWSSIESNVVQIIKEELTSDRVLKYYDVAQPITVSVDASQKGLGVAVLQKDRVISYGSRALTDAETRYAQIELELLAVVYAFQKFHKLLYGKEAITVESDHKPLESILSKPIGRAPLRLQKMMLKLQPYDFQLKHVKGKDLGLADCLSRFPVEKGSKLLDDELMVCRVECVGRNKHDEWLNATRADNVLVMVRKFIISGWPDEKSEVPDLVKPYWDVRDELSTYNGLVYKGLRLVIPIEKRSCMLGLIHKAHQGMSKTKQLARDLIYWPGMNKQIEDVVSKCEHCIKYQYNQQKEPMIISEIPTGPWQRIGTDIFELGGKTYLVIVDYFSNFIEVEHMNDTTSKSLIRIFKENFARHGLPRTLVSDNAQSFVSQEFETFLKRYDVEHVTSSPRYPQSNGQAEKAVQIIKRLLKKCIDSGDDFYEALLLLRNTPRANVGSPCERLFGRKTRTMIPTRSELLETEHSIETEVGLRQLRGVQKQYYDQHSKVRPEITPAQAIRMQAKDGTWEPAELVGFDKTPRSQTVKTNKYGHEYRRSNIHIRQTNEKPHTVESKETPMFVEPCNKPVQQNQNSPTPIPIVPPPPVTPVVRPKYHKSELTNTPVVKIPTPKRQINFSPEKKRSRKQTEFYGVRLW